jgi:hypothetical protein
MILIAMGLTEIITAVQWGYNIPRSLVSSVKLSVSDLFINHEIRE